MSDGSASWIIDSKNGTVHGEGPVSELPDPETLPHDDAEYETTDTEITYKLVNGEWVQKYDDKSELPEARR